MAAGSQRSEPMPGWLLASATVACNTLIFSLERPHSRTRHLLIKGRLEVSGIGAQNGWIGMASTVKSTTGRDIPNGGTVRVLTEIIHHSA